MDTDVSLWDLCLKDLHALEELIILFLQGSVACFLYDCCSAVSLHVNAWFTLFVRLTRLM